MENCFFSAGDLALLLAPSRWRLVAAGLADGTRRRRDTRGQIWRSGSTHAHPHREILIALRGHGSYSCADRIYDCAPGTVFAFAPDLRHDDGYPPHAHRQRHLWLAVVAGGVVARVVTVEDGCARPDALNRLFDSQRLGFDAQRLLAAAEVAAALSPDAGRATLLGAIAMICVRLVRFGEEPEPQATRNDLRAQTIAAVRRHIADRAGRDIALADLAHLAGCSVFHFCRLFKQHAGMTVHRYVDECRWMAVDRLRAQRRPWGEIGAELGFSDPTAFSRWRRLQRQRGFDRG